MQTSSATPRTFTIARAIYTTNTTTGGARELLCVVGVRFDVTAVYVC